MNDARGNGILFFRRLLSRSPWGARSSRGLLNFSSSSFWKSSFDIFPKGGKHIKRERERESPFLLSKREERGLEGKKRGGIFLFFSLFSKNRIEGETRAFLFYEYTGRLTPKGFLSLRLPLSFGSMSKHRRINTDDTR